MKRRLLNLLTFLSVLLCVAVVVLWVRSHFVYEQIGRITADHGADIVRSAQGRLHFARHSWWSSTFGSEWEHNVRGQALEGWPQYEYQQPVSERVGFARYVGTAYTWPGHLHPEMKFLPLPPRTDPRWWRDNYQVWVVPHWFLALAAGALPVWRLACRGWSIWESPRARHRRLTGLCRACGYDLRATAGQCPECGNMTAVKLGGE